MRYRLVSILAFIVFLANSSISSVAKPHARTTSTRQNVQKILLALGTVAPAKNPTSVAKDWVRVA